MKAAKAYVPKLIKENSHVILVDNQGNSKIARIEAEGYTSCVV